MANIIWSVFHLFYWWPTLFDWFLIYFTHCNHYSIGFSYILLIQSVFHIFYSWPTSFDRFSFIILIQSVFHIFYSWPTSFDQLSIYFTHGQHLLKGFSYILLMATIIQSVFHIFYSWQTPLIGFSYIILIQSVFHILLMANIY